MLSLRGLVVLMFPLPHFTGEEFVGRESGHMGLVLRGLVVLMFPLSQFTREKFVGSHWTFGGRC